MCRHARPEYAAVLAQQRLLHRKTLAVAQAVGHQAANVRISCVVGIPAACGLAQHFSRCATEQLIQLAVAAQNPAFAHIHDAGRRRFENGQLLGIAFLQLCGLQRQLLRLLPGGVEQLGAATRAQQDIQARAEQQRCFAQ